MTIKQEIELLKKEVGILTLLVLKQKKLTNATYRHFKRLENKAKRGDRR